MRYVHTNAEIPHLWAHQRQERAGNASYGGSLSFQGTTLYSYAEPIAQIVTREGKGEAFLLTSRTFSKTTSKHTSFAYGAIPNGRTVFHVPNVQPIGQREHERNIESYLQRIDETRAKAKRARIKGPWLQGRADGLEEEARRYCDFYDLADPFTPEYLAARAERIEREREEQEAAEARRAAEQARRDAAYRIEHAERAAKWRNGEAVYLSGHPDTMLRLINDGETVETSRGARVPAEDARRLLTAWRVNYACLHGASVGHYIVTQATPERLVIGCHVLERAEIERFAPILEGATCPA